MFGYVKIRDIVGLLKTNKNFVLFQAGHFVGCRLPVGLSFVP